MEPSERMGASGRSLQEAGEQLIDSLGELRTLVQERGEELRDQLANFVEERPFAAIGIAFGVGYLLSGALYSRASARLIGLSARLLTGVFLKQLMAAGSLGALARMTGK
jgi:hypothetical protein